MEDNKSVIDSLKKFGKELKNKTVNYKITSENLQKLQDSLEDSKKASMSYKYKNEIGMINSLNLEKLKIKQIDKKV